MIPDVQFGGNAKTAKTKVEEINNTRDAFVKISKSPTNKAL